MKLTRIVKWIDLKDTEREIFGVQAKHLGKWLNVTATDDETDPPFFGTKKQAKKFAKKVECKIKKAIDTDIQDFERLNNFIP